MRKVFEECIFENTDKTKNKLIFSEWDNKEFILIGIENYLGGTRRISLNKEKALELANTIIQHYSDL